MPSTPPAGSKPVALVTGGARRIGRAIGLELARHGWDLGLHFRGSAAEAEATAAEAHALGARVWLLQADLGDEAASVGLVPALRAQSGRLDAVVNNASLFEHDDVAGFGHAAMDRHWRANTAAPILLARALHAAVAAPGHPTGRGCVVNLLDQKLWAPNPDFLSYSLSKAGLAFATTMLAQALAPRVRVVGVAPGLTLPSYLQDAAAFEAAHRAHSPLGRSSTAADVAASVVFAVANRSITGSTILVDGGQHLRPLPRDVSFVPPPGP